VDEFPGAPRTHDTGQVHEVLVDVRQPVKDVDDDGEEDDPCHDDQLGQHAEAEQDH
jgi:hypothetical protein